MSALSFDLEDPPEEPPAECTDALTWRLAYSLHAAHRSAAGEACTCGRPDPCPSAQLAAYGFRFCCGLAGADTADAAKAEDAVAV